MPARKLKPIDHWAAIDAIVKHEAEPTGPEWFTIEQFCERYGKSHSNALRRLNSLEKAGDIIGWRGTSMTTHRTTRKFRHK